jgi:Ca2+-dependent lipid-binding protein
MGCCRKVRCYIFSCKDIPSADDDGQSDCYIKCFNQDGDDVRTVIVNDSLNPIFYECKEFMIEFDTLDDAPPIILNLWDENEGIGAKDSYLGRALITLKETNAKGYEIGFAETLSQAVANEIPKPSWYPIRYGNDKREPLTGQVLCSFTICPDD